MGNRDFVRKLLASWRHEIKDVSHELWKRFVLDPRGTLTVSFDSRELSVTKSNAEETVELGTFEHDRSPNPLPVAVRLAQLCATSDGATDVRLLLPADAVLRTHISMPVTSRRNLEQALRYELTRLSPLEPQQLYFDFEIERSKTPTKLHDVALRIVKREMVDEAIRICVQAGLRVASIAFEDDPRDADFRLFPVDRPAFLRALWRRWNFPLLCGFASLLGLVLLSAVYFRCVEAGEALSAQLAHEQTQAAAVARLEAEMQQTLSDSRSVIVQKRAPMLVSILTELSRTLPQNTWITQLSLEGQKLRLEGYSKSASDLIGDFDRSGMFADAEFTAPVTQDSRAGIERFDLSLLIRSRAR